MTIDPNFAAGALLGVFCGDAAGGVLEFAPSETLTRENVEKALTMSGGGHWRLGPGQPTDDSEMAMALLEGLWRSARARELSICPLDYVAWQYLTWAHSRPFDMGMTTANAVMAPLPAEGPRGGLAREMQQRARELNATSESNGCLMRIVPLALWSRPEKLWANVQAETSLTHPLMICQQACYLYCLAISHLIRHPGDRAGALRLVQRQVENPQTDEKLRGWWREATSGEPYERTVRKLQGWMRWAFTLSFYHLFRGSTYQEAIGDVLRRGGDTDTNAAIVGGLIGAWQGMEGIPMDMQRPVMAFNPQCPGEGQLRPGVYEVRRAMGLLDMLLPKE